MSMNTSTSNLKEKRHVGFAGLGAMGFGMASNLLKAGISVNGFDVNPEALRNFEAIGGQTSSSVRDASHEQRKFFVMVATPKQIDSIMFGSDGLSVCLPRSAILCLFSTLPPKYVVDLKKKLDSTGRGDIRLIDCPVSGGVVGATSGSLSVIIAGDPAAIEAIRPELEAISAPGRLFCTGALGSASVMKMLNQHLAGIHIVAAAETLAFAKRIGLSSRETYKILTKSEGASWIMGDRGISMLNADWTAKSSVTIFTKDLGIVNDTADALSLPCPMVSVALQSFTERVALGHGSDDDSSVVCNYEQITGVKVVEINSDRSVLSPRQSPSNEGDPVILIAGKEWVDQFSQFLSGQKLQIIRQGDAGILSILEDIADNAIVGVMETNIEELASKYPSLDIFDYQVTRSHDYSTLQILFTTGNRAVEIALGSGIAAAFTPVPIHGPLGSASRMYLTIQLASIMHLAATAECFALATAEGVSNQLIYELISGAAGASSQFNRIFPKMIQGDFSGSLSGNMRCIGEYMRDINSLKTMARNIGFPGRLLDTAHQIFKMVNHEQGGNVSTAALISYWGTKAKKAAKI